MEVVDYRLELVSENFALVVCSMACTRIVERGSWETLQNDSSTESRTRALTVISF